MFVYYVENFCYKIFLHLIYITNFLNFIPLYRVEIFTKLVLISIPETAKCYGNMAIGTTFYFP